MASPAALESPEASSSHSQQQQDPTFSQDLLLKVAQGQGHRSPESPEQQKKLLAQLTHLHLNGLHLQQLSSIKLCPKLQVLYLYDNKLTSVSAVAGNRLITHLYLQNNQLQSLDGLQELPLLQKLYLQNNQLSAISQLAAATRLEELHVSDQQLNFMPGAGSILQQPGNELHQQQQQHQRYKQQQQLLQHAQDTGEAAVAAALEDPAQFSESMAPGGLSFETATLYALSGSLKVLAASHCGIVDPRPLAMLHSLRTLDLSNNSISSMETLQPLLQGLKQLQCLDLRGNGCVHEVKYRDFVILLAADSLAMLDGSVVPALHRAFLLRLHMNKMKAHAGRSQEQQHFQQHKCEGQAGQQSQWQQQQQQLKAEDAVIEQEPLKQQEAAAAARFQSNKGALPGLLEASASAAELADGVGSIGLSGTGIKLHPCKAPAARPPAVAGFNINATRISAALGTAASSWVDHGNAAAIHESDAQV